MKAFLFSCIVLIMTLSGCSGWAVEPLPYTPPPTPFLTPTAFPNSPTPVVLPPPITATVLASATNTQITPTQSTGTPTLTPSPTLTSTLTAAAATATVTNTITPTPIATITIPSALPPSAQVNTTILSCNTSFDILHGMGEVTNAYVTVANIGSSEIDNMCATLNGLDEGRPHPDKTKCIPALPAGYQVTFKLTVDTTFKQGTPIQVDVTSKNIGLLQRVGKDSCSDVDIVPPDYDGLGKVTPIP